MSTESTPHRSAAVVADVIRSEILAGDYSRGEPLREISLTERFGVSRRTVREALLALTTDGLVTHKHNQGASVRVFDPSDVRDLYSARRVLETEAARHAPTAKQSLLDDINDAYEALERAALQGLSSVALAEADAKFHGRVIALLCNSRFDEFYESIAMQMSRVIAIVQELDVEFERDLAAVVAEHRAIKDALMHRDPWEAQRLISDHIDTHQRNILSSLPA